MKVWADHQKSNGETQLKCPLCREQFSTFELLDQEYRTNSLNKLEKQDLHYGLVCKSCKSTPIAGKIYKCTECTEFYLCQSCFNTDFHDKHSFVFREVIVVFVLINSKEYLKNLNFFKENQSKISSSKSRSRRVDSERISSRTSSTRDRRRRLRSVKPAGGE